MAVNSWSCFFRTITLISASYPHPLHFDVSNPKIVLGLLIGGILPYLIPAIPAAVTKWLLFALVFRLRARPSVLRLCAVSLAEAFCFFAAVRGALWLNGLIFFRFGTLAICAVLATFPNLLLFTSTNQRSSYRLLKRSLYALATGFIYLSYMILFWLALFMWPGLY